MAQERIVFEGGASGLVAGGASGHVVGGASGLVVGDVLGLVVGDGVGVGVAHAETRSGHLLGGSGLLLDEPAAAQRRLHLR
eukprot:1206995-Pyramimonas_sp.AAC.1